MIGPSSTKRVGRKKPWSDFFALILFPKKAAPSSLCARQENMLLPTLALFSVHLYWRRDVRKIPCYEKASKILG